MARPGIFGKIVNEMMALDDLPMFVKIFEEAYGFNDFSKVDTSTGSSDEGGFDGVISVLDPWDLFISDIGGNVRTWDQRHYMMVKYIIESVPENYRKSVMAPPNQYILDHEILAPYEIMLWYESERIIEHVFEKHLARVGDFTNLDKWLIYSIDTYHDYRYFDMIIRSREQHSGYPTLSKSLKKFLHIKSEYLLGDDTGSFITTAEFLRIWYNCDIPEIQYVLDNYCNRLYISNQLIPVINLIFDTIPAMVTYDPYDPSRIMYDQTKYLNINLDISTLIEKVRFILNNGADPNITILDNNNRLINTYVYGNKLERALSNVDPNVYKYKAQLIQNLYIESEYDKYLPLQMLIKQYNKAYIPKPLNSTNYYTSMTVDTINTETSSKTVKLMAPIIRPLIDMLLQYGADPLMKDNIVLKNKNSIETVDSPTLKSIFGTVANLNQNDPFASAKQPHDPSYLNIFVASYLGLHALLYKWNRVYSFNKTNLNIVDSSGSTPLHYAINHSGSWPTIHFLLRHGADFDIPNNDGITPFQILNTLPHSFELYEIILDILHSNPISYLHYIPSDIINYIKPFL